MFESKEKKAIKFEKKLYDTKIIQSMFDAIAELEGRIRKLEQR